MASNFTGWGSSWGDSWGPVGSDPNAMYGIASITFTATGTLQGIVIDQPTTPGAGGRPAFNPWAPWPHHHIPHRRPKKRRQDDILFLR